MRRIFCFALMLCMLLLSGCAREAVPPQTQHPSQPELNIAGISTEKWYQVPAYTGAPLIEADPERAVYISLINQDCDFYPLLDGFYGNIGYGYSFTLLTKEHVAIKDIKVRFPIQTGYDINIMENTKYCHALAQSGVSNLGMDLQHYLSLQGIDWQACGQMASDASTAAGYYFELGRTDLETYQQLLQIYEDPYDAQRDAYQAAYKALSEDDIPMFYAYYVGYIFHDYCDETIDSV